MISFRCQGIWVFLIGSVSIFLGCRPSADDPVAMPRTPTQVIEKFETQDLRDGIKTMSLESSEARIYDDQNVAEVEKPLLTFYKNGVLSSRLKAPKGRVDMRTHKVEAWGGVQVVTVDSATLTTEKLQYDPGARRIVSKDSVHLEKPDSVTDGIGLEADPELKRVKIGKQKVRLKKL